MRRTKREQLIDAFKISVTCCAVAAMLLVPLVAGLVSNSEKVYWIAGALMQALWWAVVQLGEWAERLPCRVVKLWPDGQLWQCCRCTAACKRGMPHPPELPLSGRGFTVWDCPTCGHGRCSEA